MLLVISSPSFVFCAAGAPVSSATSPRSGASARSAASAGSAPTLANTVGGGGTRVPPPTVFAIGDIHGDWARFEAVLTAAGLATFPNVRNPGDGEDEHTKSFRVFGRGRSAVRPDKHKSEMEMEMDKRVPREMEMRNDRTS